MKKAALWGLLLLTALLGGCAPKEEPCVGICYEITGGKNPMTILGSIHIGNESMSRYEEKLNAAIEAADVFVFECDNESAEARRAAAELRKAKVPLGEAVSAESYALLAKVAQAEGYSQNALDALRPWAATSLLSARVAAAELGVRDATSALALGVEETVRKRVNGREIAYLETAREQLEILDGFSPALQDEMLQSACELILESTPTSLPQWPEWWRQGNAAAFATAYEQENERSDPALTREYHDGLVTKRNKAMAKKLAQLLEGEEPRRYFVTMGLLHLVLPGDSVLDELQSMGYQAEQLLK